jgi:hypothetical protein
LEVYDMAVTGFEVWYAGPWPCEKDLAVVWRLGVKFAESLR